MRDGSASILLPIQWYAPRTRAVVLFLLLGPAGWDDAEMIFFSPNSTLRDDYGMVVGGMVIRMVYYMLKSLAPRV